MAVRLAAAVAARGGARIQAPGQPTLTTVATGVASLAAAGAIAADVIATADRAGARSVAATGVVLLVVAVVVRARSLVPGALVLLGVAYALALEEHSRAVDGDAVLLAPAFLLTAELAYWSLEPRAIRAGREVVLPRIGVLAGLVAATALAAAFLVGTAAFDVHGTAALVGVGVVAATGALALSARLARRG